MFYKLSILALKDMTEKEKVEIRNQLHPDKLFNTKPKNSNHGLLNKLMYSLGQKKIVHMSSEKLAEAGLVNIIDDLKKYEFISSREEEVVSFYLYSQVYNEGIERYELSVERLMNQAQSYLKKMIPNITVIVQKVDQIPRKDRLIWLKKELADAVIQGNKELFFNLSQLLDQEEQDELVYFAGELFPSHYIDVKSEYSPFLFSQNEMRPYFLQLTAVEAAENLV